MDVDNQEPQPVLEISSQKVTPKELSQLVRQSVLTGTMAVLEFYDESQIPSEEDVALRKEVCKRILKRHYMCHTVIIRMGCYVSVFRNTRKANPLTTTPGEGWYLHPNGFLLLWGSQQIPHDSLPAAIGETEVKTWKESLLSLITWLNSNTEVVLL